MLQLIINSVLLGVGLAMDAFSISIANGIVEPGMRKRRMLLIAGDAPYSRSLRGISVPDADVRLAPGNYA